MKYVSVDMHLGDMVRRIVVAFPNDLTHALMAKAVEVVCQTEWKGCKTTVHAAGEIEVEADSTHGESLSLGIKADPEDARMFNLSDYAGHIW